MAGRRLELEEKDEDDLLAFLDVEYRREQWRIRQKESRLRKKRKTSEHANATGEVMLDHFQPLSDVDDQQQDLLSILDVEHGREKCRNRRRQSRLEKKQQTTREGATVTGTSDPFQPLSKEEQDKCMHLLRSALGADGLDECVCAVCDRVVLRSDSDRKDGSDWRYMEVLRNVLGEASADIPAELLDYYRAPLLISSLDNVMVSPRGIHSYVDEHGYPGSWLSVCTECSASIRHRKLPKFSIANGFYVGALPDHLSGLTIPERMLTQLSTISATTRVMRGGQHRCIRSHCIAFDCTPGPALLLLPRSIEDLASYRVVMIGDFTEGQIRKVKKMHRIRNGVVREVLGFYKTHNRLYANVTSSGFLDVEYSNDGLHDQFMEHVADNGGEFDSAMDAEQQNIRAQSDAWRVLCESDEDTVVERRVGLISDEPPNLTRAEPSAREVEGAPQGDRVFLVRRSDHVSYDASGDLLAKLFPHLFPFGRGHPGESRRVAVSLIECVKYYIELSSRRFAEDELFALVAFDRISMQNMFIHNSVRCKRFPSLYEGYENISAEQLGNALLTNERRRQGCLPRSGSSDRTVNSFLKTVELATGAIWGSNAERTRCRQQAFACQARFGQPALFVTLTPNTDNALVMAQYTGVTSVKTLFDALDARMPTKAELREATLGNDCASARLFMRQVDAFIKYVLGMDPVTRKPMQLRGLLGVVETYFGMVETQGRGALHIHFLIWLKGCPPNSVTMEKILESNEADHFRSSVAAYAHSIVSNELPISLAEQACSKCGASYSSLVALPIPETAHKDPQAGIRSLEMRNAVREPVLLQCNTCKTRFSSQHALRSALLQHRPLYWPAWERPLSTEEMLDQVKSELGCRDTLQHAVDIVQEREKIFASLSDERDVKDESGLTPAEAEYFLETANSFRMSFCRSDDDPFQNDHQTRLIEMLPPAPSDSRMSKASIDYMVSALVLLLNQHWWCHTGSCFKNSNAAGNANMCRYSFPKERVKCTRFGPEGVETERSPGHEFINGYNYTIMATFKCNHDIQLLLGGRDTTDRVYYCCKYVTKHQHRLDSIVPVALAALKRRQEREGHEKKQNGDQHALTAARKRVASMAYALTNRQEVAGPLAALYLYRGSCSYTSAKFASLPLGDVIRQLCTEDNYSCSLVSEGDSVEISSFRAVSFLDDYIYRPKTLSKLNLYEFVMRYYRKKDDSAPTNELAFRSEHPLHQSHRLVCRYEEVVPVVQSYRLPYVDTSSSPETRSKHAILSLVLFKPFRCLEDLISASTTSADAWINAFTTWNVTRSEFVETIMNNMNDYHQASVRNDLPTASKVADIRDEEDSDSTDADALFDNDELDANDCEFSEDVNTPNIWELDESYIIDAMCLSPSVCPTSAAPDDRVMRILDAFTTFGMLECAATATATRVSNSPLAEAIPHLDYMRRWIADADSDNAIICPSQTAESGRDTLVLELLDNALNESSAPWTPPTSNTFAPANAVQPFSSISDISRAFTLNEKQHYCVKIIGTALLTRWRNSESLLYASDEFENRLREDQLQLFLGGEGGTGKSRVIDAVQSLCASWGRSSGIVKTALTGKAATIIGGRTLESFLLQLMHGKAVEAVVNLDIIVIDEISMMRRTQLAKLDRLLRKAKRLPNVAFGGVHVALVGDFLQLPPVGADPIYRDPTGITKKKYSASDIAGYQLWRGFEAVIILDESVRFRRDPEWGRGCRKARRGVWTPEFVAIINSRVVSRETAFDEWHSSDAMTKFVTPDNLTRVAINSLFVSSTAKALPRGEYPLRVVANFKGKLAGLSGDEVRMVMSLPDTKFGRMPPYLDLIIGMPIQVTQNIRPQKMVANGTIGTLEAIIFEPGTTFRLVHDKVADMVVKIPSSPPPAVLVRISRGETATPMQGSDDADLFPLFFASEPYGESHIALKGGSSSQRRELSVRIQQFPLTCAISSTVYKVQGDTLDRMVVTEWLSNSRVSNKPQQPYLLVSRVTSRSAFATLTALTPEIMKWAHPPPDALEEEIRLLELSRTTLRSLM